MKQQDRIIIAKELLKIANIIIGSTINCNLLLAYNDTPNNSNQNFQVYLSPEGREFLQKAVVQDEKRLGKEQYNSIRKERKKTKSKTNKSNLSDVFTNCCRSLKNSRNGVFNNSFGEGKTLTDMPGLFEMVISLGNIGYRWCYFKLNNSNTFIILNGFYKKKDKQPNDLKNGIALKEKYEKEGIQNCRLQ